MLSFWLLGVIDIPTTLSEGLTVCGVPCRDAKEQVSAAERHSSTVSTVRLEDHKRVKHELDALHDQNTALNKETQVLLVKLSQLDDKASRC